MTKRLATIGLVALVAIVLIAAACGGDTQEQTAPAETQEPGNSPESLVGTYRFDLGGQDSWTVRLSGDGRFKLLLNNPRHLDAKGRYRIEGDRMVVRDEVSGEGPLCRKDGTYRWNLSGGRLTMEEIADPCTGRIELWTAGWTKTD